MSSTVATAGWPFDSAMNAASSGLSAGQGWKEATPLMGIFLAPAQCQQQQREFQQQF
jgi:hypothetical protein